MVRPMPRNDLERDIQCLEEKLAELKKIQGEMEERRNIIRAFDTITLHVNKGVPLVISASSLGLVLEDTIAKSVLDHISPLIRGA